MRVWVHIYDVASGNTAQKSANSGRRFQSCAGFERSEVQNPDLPYRKQCPSPLINRQVKNLNAATGSQTRNWGLDGTDANRYTIDAA